MRGTVMTYAVLAALVMGSAAVAQNNPNQPSPLASASAQTTAQAETTATGKQIACGRRRSVIASPAFGMCRLGFRIITASDPSRTRPSTGNCASAAIAEVCSGASLSETGRGFPRCARAHHKEPRDFVAIVAASFQPGMKLMRSARIPARGGVLSFVTEAL